MSADAAAPASSGFATRSILVLVLVGIIAFAALSVLSVYAPDFRGASDGGAHALSPSAVGFRGATVMLKAMGTPVVISRTPAQQRPADGGRLLVLTPKPGAAPAELAAFKPGLFTLIIMPKWETERDPLRPPYVRKAGAMDDRGWSARMLSQYGKVNGLNRRSGVSKPVLRGAGGPFAPGTVLPLAPVDRLQTFEADGWAPALVDETGAMVLAYSKSQPNVLVLSDPDLLNNQGLAKLDNARAGMAILQTLSGEDGVAFDVTLAGFARGRSIGRLMLEPPWLAATLCVLAAAFLMGLHALARFGPARESGRAIALGAGALVDNSAGLVRMARKEAALAPQYVELSKARVARAVGLDRAGPEGDPDAWLAELARRRGLATPAELTAEAARARTPGDLLDLGRRLYRWRGEMTREGG